MAEQTFTESTLSIRISCQVTKIENTEVGTVNIMLKNASCVKIFKFIYLFKVMETENTVYGEGKIVCIMWNSNKKTKCQIFLLLLYSKSGKVRTQSI